MAGTPQATETAQLRAAARGGAFFGGGQGSWGDYFAVGLGAVAGACVGRWTGQPRMPPRERQHEGLGERRHEGVFGLGGLLCGWTGSRCGSMCWPVDRPATHAAAGAAARGGFWFGGILLRLDWESLREHVLAGGPASHACRRGSGSTRG